jgi:SAM-dependent methyltransferase
MTDPRIPVSYSLPRTNAKVLALLEPHLSSAALVLDIGAGEGYLAQRVHAAIVERGLSARLEACDLFPDNFHVPDVHCRPIDLDGGLPLPDASVDLARCSGCCGLAGASSSRRRTCSA